MNSKSSVFLLLFLLCFSSSIASPQTLYQSFLRCLSLHATTTNASQILFTPLIPSSFSSLLNSSIKNLRFTSPTTPKPLLIIRPTEESHIQASVLCSRYHLLSIRVRSGGHDYEGLSYRSVSPSWFVLIELSALKSVAVDAGTASAWVQAGATVGELLYGIAQQSETLGFIEGTCPTVGVGGFISGGGIGNMVRKYGLAADNVVDARIVDAKGRMLDRETMGEDLFWAIRGGSGSSFGVIVSWKVRLLPVPPTVTVFTVNKAMADGGLQLVNRWQYIAHRLHEDLFISVTIRTNGNGGGQGVEAVFRSLFLGDCDLLLQLMNQSFPELGVEKSDCRELSWVRSYLYLAGYTGDEQLEVLMDRGALPKSYIKGKSDYVRDPIPSNAWERIWEMLMEDGGGIMLMIPHGGAMSEVPRNATPYPHRRGTLYVVQYLVVWTESDESDGERHLDWIRRLYEEMGPYVSKNPREAYVNHRDLDLGWNVDGGGTSYAEARVWGRKYFKSNFRRLAMVKGEVDPDNVFVFEQSIPPLSVSGKRAIG